MLEGNFYHLYNRGINKQKIFFEDKNYVFFLRKFDEYLSSYIDTYAYCLMPNHFHFLVRIHDLIEKENNRTNSRILPPLEKAFRDFFISYAKAINKAQNRTGALFQARFKRRSIVNEKYLVRLIPYIHLNPVRAKLCCKPNDWKYSSYNSFLNDKPTKIKRDQVIGLFGSLKSFIELHNTYESFQIERDFLFKEIGIINKIMKENSSL